MTVSIIIPCYNQGRFLADAVNSALAQKGVEVEVVVVNDGSTDNTAEVALSYGSQIVFVDQPNQGLSRARNAGVAHSRGTWLQFLDADDLLTPDKIRVQLDLGERAGNARVGCVYGGWTRVDAERRKLEECFARVPAPAADAFLKGNYFPPHAAIVRRQAFDSVGGFDPTLQGYADWDFWLRLALADWGFQECAGHGALYRLHGANMSGSSLRMLEEGVRLLEKHAAGVRGDVHREELARAGQARMQLMLSLFHGVYENAPAKSTEHARQAFEAAAGRGIDSAGLWAQPFSAPEGSPPLTPEQLYTRALACDRWACDLVLPAIRDPRLRRAFLAGYRLWIMRLLHATGQRALARRRLFRLLNSRGGIATVLRKRQKSLVLDLCLGRRVAGFLRGFLRGNLRIRASGLGGNFRGQ